MSRVAFSLCLSIAAVSLSAQSAYLVKDINSVSTSSPLPSYPRDFFRHGTKIYFAATDPVAGEELYVTDGTESGTALVADILPGNRPSSPSRFAVVNGRLVFNAKGTVGEELWMTDGTQDGTRVMADIYSGGRSSSPGARIVHGGTMLFAADDGVHGPELWITDGTPAGTRFFKDLTPGPEGSFPGAFVLLDGTIYFGTSDALWKTDGTEAGTVIVKSGMTPRDLVVAGSRIFFTGTDAESGAEPWVSDGTEAGTRRLADILPGAEGSRRYSGAARALGDRILFVARNATHGSELWVTDGTEAGTHVLVDIVPGEESGVDDRAMTAVLGDLAVFVARNAQNKLDLWQTDGTSGGTSLVRGFGARSAHGVIGPVAVGGRAAFLETDGRYDRIWVTDGTAAGTVPVTSDDLKLHVWSQFTNIDGTLYFAAANRLNGHEPWKSDLTAAGTRMIRNLATDPAPSSEARGLRAAEDYLYFSAWNGVESPIGNDGSSLWRTDGTAEGTIEISDEIPPSHLPLATVGRLLFFHTNDWSSALMVSDGTPEGTKRATEIEQRFRESISIRFVFGDTLIVSSDRKLWATKLAAGSPIVQLGRDAIQGFADHAGRAVILSYDDHTLSTTDGTAAGTYIVRTFADGFSGAIAVMAGHVYFTAYDGNETKLWRSDGTASGTIAFAAAPPMQNAVVAGNRLYFTAGEGGALWVTDGTPEGTRELAVAPASALAPIGASVVFGAADTASGSELWISDGTATGTRLLFDIAPGQGGSYPRSVTAAPGFAYFTATSNTAGNEVWITDGTPSGTRVAADVEPGTPGSFPSDLHRSGERLFFSATTSATGRELWAMPLPSGPRINIQDVRVEEGQAGTTRARFTATLTAASTQPVTVAWETSDGTASASSDYESASGTLTWAAGETTKTFEVLVRGDNTSEGNETFLVTLRNAAGATIERAAAAGIIEDEDQVADIGLEFDFSHFFEVLVDVVNHGPGTATNLRGTMTAVPASTRPSDCWRCPLISLEPDERERAFQYGGYLDDQQYVTASVAAREADPNPSNNTLAWTVNGVLTMNALHLTPGASAIIAVRFYQPMPFSVESSDPTVVTVPANVSGSMTFAVQGIRAGTATVRVFTSAETLGTLVVDVLEPGARQRYPDAIRFFPDAFNVPFDQITGMTISRTGTAPFSGAQATGTVTISSGGVELARTTFSEDSGQSRLQFRLPSVGVHPITAHYPGDENFLPVTFTSDVTVSKGLLDASATAMRHGADVIVRVRLTGSPAATPTGTVSVATESAELVAVGLGSEVDIRVPNVAPETETIDYFYEGDANYRYVSQTLTIHDPRRRSSRH